MSKTDFTTLTIERLREVLDYCPETGLFTWRVSRGNRVIAGSAAGCLKPSGYVAIGIDCKSYLAHRLALFWVNGELPKATDVDHKDRNPSNNRFANLRELTHLQNSQNSNLSKANSSGYKGVHWRSKDKRWAATILLQGVSLWLGRFSSLSDAVAARKMAEIAHHPYRVIN